MVKKPTIKLISAFTSFALLVSLAGCSGAKTTPEVNAPAPTQAAGSASVYPLKASAPLKVWSNNYAPDICSSYSELDWAKEAEKKTGVKIEWMHSGSSTTLDMVIASGDLPDIIINDWPSYKGGPEKALNDGTIIALNDIMDKYAPNLKSYLKKYPEIDKMVKTDSSKYLYFPMVRGFPRQGFPDGATVYQGPIVRQDWLDDLGIKMPETTDDWYAMLRAFKDKKNAASPLSVEKKGTMLIGSFGLTNGMFVDNGKVKYGPIEPAYKDYLILHSKWYKEGLIDKQYGTVEKTALATKMTGGESGASYGLMGGSLESWMNSMKGKDAKYKLVAIPYPKVKGSNYPVIGTISARIGLANAAISRTCKNVEVAARYLDWGYSEQGSLTYNFGVEGASYKMVNGYPTVVPELFQGSGKSKYVWPNGPLAYDTRYDEQMTTPEKIEFTKRWTTEAEKYKLPPITMTTEELAQIADSKAEVDNYVGTMFPKFITGAEPLDNFDTFVAQVKKMGIDKIIQANQVALDRYNKR